MLNDRDKENERLDSVLTQYKQEQDQLRKDNDEHTKNIDSQETEIQRLNEALSNKVSQLDNLQAEKQDILAAKSQLEVQITAVEEERNSYCSKHKEGILEIERLKHLGKEKDQTIAAMRQEIQGLRADLVGLETTLKTQNATIDDLGINLAHTIQEREQLSQIASIKQQEVNSLVQ